jgi:3-methylfumaryl-CoA hydratase
LAIEEQQDLVYREASPANPLRPGQLSPGEPQWSREIHPDPVLLFRYSALTFNGHRIHYDRDYAQNTENYAGLVVQGPLTATLLLDLLRREMPGAQVGYFRFRGMRPLLDTATFRIQGMCEGKTVRLWALDAEGFMAMDAEVSLV